MSLKTFSITALMDKSKTDIEKVKTELSDAEVELKDDAETIVVKFKKECKSFSVIDNIVNFRNKVGSVLGLKVTDSDHD